IALSNGSTLTLDYSVNSAPAASPMSIVQTTTVISGTGNLVKSGPGILGIASANTYSGSTTINDGELRMRNTTNRLPTGTDLTVNSPGIFDLSGLSQQVGSLSGNGYVGLANATLTVSGTNSTTFSGSINDTASTILATTAPSAATGGGLTKAGA